MPEKAGGALLPPFELGVGAVSPGLMTIPSRFLQPTVNVYAPRELLLADAFIVYSPVAATV